MVDKHSYTLHISSVLTQNCEETTGKTSIIIYIYKIHKQPHNIILKHMQQNKLTVAETIHTNVKQKTVQQIQMAMLDHYLLVHGRYTVHQIISFLRCSFFMNRTTDIFHHLKLEVRNFRFK